MINYVYTNKPIILAADAAIKSIKEHLAKQDRVLWLLTGGSGIDIAVQVNKQLKDVDLSKLFISLTDERYGPIGHKDENWQQLLDAGFNLTNANLYRPLINKSAEETEIELNNWLSEQIRKADYKIGLFGIGADGHTAGLKPNSSAVQSSDLVASFKGDDFERITITFNAIKQLDEAIIQATGNDKRPAIHRLVTSDLSPNIQPAQILKSIPHVTLYTNINEGEL